MHLELGFVVDSIKGKLLAGNEKTIVNGVEIDSRRVKPGYLFFAFKGESSDGHDFLEDAWKNGAAAVIVSRGDCLTKAGPGKAIILVNDTLDALQDLAAAYRRSFNIPVVAVTGSVGKTSTKDLLALCLQSRFKTLKTRGNYNNEMGLPLTLLQLDETHQVAVLEMAMRGQGELLQLATIAQPSSALISNVEKVHLETLGSLENIARAKAEVLAALRAGDFALINGDSPLLEEAVRPYAAKKYRFGYSKSCDFRIEETIIKNQGIEIRLICLGQLEKLFLPLPSRRWAMNAVAAAAMAFLLGVPLEEIKSSLLNFNPGSQRLEIIPLPAGGKIINDTYNANPLSMINALETSRELQGKGKLVAVMGDMLELGDYEQEGHREVGRHAVKNQVDLLICIGERAAWMAEAARAAGMAGEQVKHYLSKEESIGFLKQSLSSSDTILFKASRGMQLESLAEEIYSEVGRRRAEGVRTED